ncbi:MAG: DNA-3-methyladenine glycosylase I [marine bacterium B5-7]|nr:MAG: DNA-3-methyladenine glycosylase I [marine bacterium B5-7]
MQVQALNRCDWCTDNPLYMAYHDQAWGVPVHDDRVLFEFLILESMQAGLNWLTILKKRDNFRRAFANFDPEKVACFTDKDQQDLMQDAGIIRNRLKIESAINNAKQFLVMQTEYGSFSKFLWDFVGGKPIQNHYKQHADIPAKTELSDKLSKTLKKHGFRFVGSTICYAYMQAVGLVNDHLTTCHCYNVAASSEK